MLSMVVAARAPRLPAWEEGPPTSKGSRFRSWADQVRQSRSRVPLLVPVPHLPRSDGSALTDTGDIRHGVVLHGGGPGRAARVSRRRAFAGPRWRRAPAGPLGYGGFEGALGLDEADEGTGSRRHGRAARAVFFAVCARVVTVLR